MARGSGPTIPIYIDLESSARKALSTWNSFLKKLSTASTKYGEKSSPNETKKLEKEIEGIIKKVDAYNNALAKITSGEKTVSAGFTTMKKYSEKFSVALDELRNKLESSGIRSSFLDTFNAQLEALKQAFLDIEIELTNLESKYKGQRLSNIIANPTGSASTSTASATPMPKSSKGGYKPLSMNKISSLQTEMEGFIEATKTADKLVENTRIKELVPIMDAAAKKAQELREELARTPKGTEEYKNLQDQIKAVDRAIIDTSDSAKMLYDKNFIPATAKRAENSFRALESRMNKYYRRLQSADPTSPKFEILLERYQEAKDKLEELNIQMGEFDGAANQNALSINNILKKLVSLEALRKAWDFFDQVKQMTAEFELQNVALGALLQNKDAANTMFEQIKQASLQSPFEVKQLVTFTKQLAAYRIEANKLFPTMSKLADISAGLGVEMDRLILAYGQVKAATVLRGQELRQFTEAGVPMVQALADKLSEMNNRVVETSEVFDLVAKRVITFEMVDEVINDLTGKTGQFFEMQKTQAKTLKGMIVNMEDARNIMLAEIGETEVIKDAMYSLNTTMIALMENWRTVFTLISSTVTGLIAVRLATKDYSVSLKYATKKKAEHIAAQRIERKNRRLEINEIGRAIVARQAEGKSVTLLTMKQKLYNWQLEKMIICQNRAVAANSRLIAAFWKLAAAMAKNPIGAAIIALSVLVGVISAVINKSKEAKEELTDVEKASGNLFNSIDKHNKNKDDNKSILRELDNLTSKAKLNQRETKRLADLTERMYKLYGKEAVNINQSNGAMTIRIEKLRELMALEEKHTRMQVEEGLRNAKYQKAQLEQKRDEQMSIYGFRTQSELYSPDLTKRQRKWADSIIKIIDQIQSWDNTIAEAYNRLEDKPEVKVDTGWRAKLLDKNFAGFGAYDRLTIESMEGFTEMLDDAAKKYKEHKDKLATISKSITDNLDDSTRKDLENQKVVEEGRAKQFYAILEYFNALDLIADKQKKVSSSNVQSFIDDQSKFIETIEKTYNTYRKYLNQTKALAETRNALRDKGKSLGIDVDKINVSQDGTLDILGWYESAIRKVQDELKKHKNLADLSIEQLINFKTTDKDLKGLIDLLQKLFDQKIKIETSRAEKTLKDSLSKLSKKISRSKEAKTFWEDIFTSTGSASFANNVTKKIYGTTGRSIVNDQMKAIRNMFNGVKDASKYISEKDWNKLLDLVPNLPEASRSEAEKMINEQITEEVNWLKDLLKTYETALSYSERVAIVRNRTANTIAKIDSSDLLTPDQKKTYKNAANKQMLQELANIRSEALQASEEWELVFKDLDTVGGRSVENVINKLKTFIALNKAALDPTDLKTLNEKLQELEAAYANKNPFKVIADGWNEAWAAIGKSKLVEKYTKEELKAYEAYEAALMEKRTLQDKLSTLDYKKDAKKGEDAEQDKINEEYETTQKRLSELNNVITENAVAWNKVSNAQKEANKTNDEFLAGLKKVKQALGGINANIDVMSGLVNSVRDLTNATDDSTAAAWFEGINEGLNEMTNLVNTVDSAVAVIQMLNAASSGGSLGVIAIALGAIYAIFKGWKAANIKAINDEIKIQEGLIDSLSRAYKRLEEAEKNAYGSDYIDAYQQKLTILRAKQRAYQKQYDKEMEKGKDADKDKLEEYKNKVIETGDEIVAAAQDVSERLTGTNLTNAAKDFANAWIDAYKSFSSTTSAMNDKFDEMIKNMIAESLAAKAVQAILKPVFDLIDELAADGEFSEFDIAQVVTAASGATDMINTALGLLMERLRNAGISVRSLGSGMQGISKDIATASEESILSLAAGINTQNYYLSGIYQSVNNVVALLMGRQPETENARATAQNMVQNASNTADYMSYLPTIAENTANTVTECKNIVSELRKVIVPKSGNSGYRILTK